MDVNVLREVVTVLSFAAFLGIVWFAVAPANKERFDKAAMVPLNDETDETPTPTLPQGGGRRS